MKSVLKKLFLHGRVLDKWTLRKARRIEGLYRAQLLSSGSALGARPAPARSVRTPLRNLLLIADCAWEEEELVPELARIAPVKLLNLHPELVSAADGHEKNAVVRNAIQFFSGLGGDEPDAILFYARGSLLSDEVFDILRRRWKAPLIGINLDDKAQFFNYDVYQSGDDNYQSWARKFDLNLTSSVLAADWYRKLKLPVLHCPMGFRRRPENAHAPESMAFKYKFSFVGSRRLEREKIVAEILRAGLPLSVFGRGWPGSAWAQNPTQIFRDTQLNLGIGYWSPAGRLTNEKARDFECPAAGACYLTTFNWELAEHYEIGREILCWSSIEELFELYSYYAPRPEACLRIAQAAHRRCAIEHTWEQRFRTVFREMGFQV